MYHLNREILFEDNHLIIINKLPGDIVQSDKTGDESLLEKVKKYIKDKYNKPGNVYLGLVHRIDRPTSGAVIFAKTSKALSRLNKMLKSRDITKTYLAVVENVPPKNTQRLTHFLKKNKSQNKSYAQKNESGEAKKAILEYSHILSSKNYHLLQIDLFTGRHHQIRAQLAEIGCAIKGDVKYGAKRNNPDYSIDLHAYKLNFMHPVRKNEMQITAKVPNTNLWLFFEKHLSN